jgi:putative oxidoreductase
MKSLITLSFVPSLENIGLLVLRLWFGAALCWIHGLDKLIHMSKTIEQFGSMGYPGYLAVGATMAETVAAGMIVVGFATRWAAMVVGTTMFIAFSQVHHFDLNPANQPNGELAFLYLGACATLLLTGGGRFSLDTLLSRPDPVYVAEQ